MRKNWKLLIVVLAIFSLIAAACGDDDDSSESSSDGSEATDDGGDSGGPADFCLEIPGADDAEGDGSDLTVGMTFDLLGRGDQSFNDIAACGLDKAVEVFGISFNEIVPTDESARETDLQLNAENSDLVFGNGFSFRDGAIVVSE
ncbi:MAG: hypothetical protein ACR2N9_08060, partial [Acidimicrobiia bacterium]